MSRRTRQPTDPARIRYLANDWEYYSSLRIAIKCAHITARIFTEGGVKIDVVVECLETGRAWLVAPDGTLVEQSGRTHVESIEMSHAAGSRSPSNTSPIESIEQRAETTQQPSQRAERLAKATKMLGRLADTARDRDGRISGRTALGSKD